MKMMNKTKICPDNILAITIGLVYLWFGILKFIPGLSPADQLAAKTIDSLTFGIIPSRASVVLLAIWETLVGILLIFNLFRKQSIILALVHMACTFTPLVLFPDLSFTDSPFGLSLIGQYIFKNIIIVGALIVILRLRTSPNRCHLC